MELKFFMDYAIVENTHGGTVVRGVFGSLRSAQSFLDSFLKGVPYGERNNYRVVSVKSYSEPFFLSGNCINVEV